MDLYLRAHKVKLYGMSVNVGTTQFMFISTHKSNFECDAMPKGKGKVVPVLNELSTTP
jgi:hypothetical protein